MHAYAPCWAGASGGARPEEANEAGEGHGRSNPGRKKQGEGGGNQPDTGCVPATTPSGLAGTQARSHARHARHAPRTHPHCRSLEAAVAQDAATPRPVPAVVGTGSGGPRSPDSVQGQDPLLLRRRRRRGPLQPCQFGGLGFSQRTRVHQTGHLGRPRPRRRLGRRALALCCWLGMGPASFRFVRRPAKNKKVGDDEAAAVGDISVTAL